MDRDQKLLLAGELALGLLEGDERRDALDLVARDPVARDEYDLWQARFAALGDEVPAAESGPARRVRRDLGAMTAREPARIWLRGWWRDLVRMFSDAPWVVMLLTVKAGLILYLVLLFL